MVYWTRENQQLDEIDCLEKPDEKQIGNLLDSVASGKKNVAQAIEDDVFYSFTLSGSAARIAVRDWIEVSLSEYRRNIGQWFKDIAIKSFGKTYYAPLYWLARAGHNEKSDSDTTLSRTATHLWNAALKNSKPPLWILHAVLKRLRYIEPSDDGGRKNDSITKERAALIRLIINRNRKEGGYEMNEQLDKENLCPAYVCGQIFAVMVAIQRAALGKDINAGLRERYFSYASTTPAPAFGRLMKLAQTHLTKLKADKPGLQVILDRELQSECAKLKDNSFPAILLLEEQGQFALGYYHKKEETWQKAMANKELKEALEKEEEEK
jgi:CRISPR-associated protein Csd1